MSPNHWSFTKKIKTSKMDQRVATEMPSHTWLRGSNCRNPVLNQRVQRDKGTTFGAWVTLLRCLAILFQAFEFYYLGGSNPWGYPKSSSKSKLLDHWNVLKQPWLSSLGSTIFQKPPMNRWTFHPRVRPGRLMRLAFPASWTPVQETNGKWRSSAEVSQAE